MGTPRRRRHLAADRVWALVQRALHCYCSVILSTAKNLVEARSFAALRMTFALNDVERGVLGRFEIFLRSDGAV
jgi:hypothetical protein